MLGVPNRREIIVTNNVTINVTKPAAAMKITKSIPHLVTLQSFPGGAHVSESEHALPPNFVTLHRVL